ncbi:MAG: hypothetical protein NTV94_13095, partial [Planctomycetota bacterium]|nr:hypothetical protein [Planctomycetota bacterium]
RERLFRLREDGSGVESKALTDLAPHWKRFTGWVSTAMAQERQALEAAGAAAGAADEADRAIVAPSGLKGKAALPPSRRAATTVNADAGEWAQRPGILPQEVHAYRWLLEDLRLALFVPDLGGVTVPASRLEQAWAQVVKAAQDAASGQGERPRR